MSFEQKYSSKAFSGQLTKYSFSAFSLGGLNTSINVFIPPNATKAPVLYYLSGLTCTEDNAAQKGAFFQEAAKQGIAIVFPDTSPRGANIEGEDESYDFGSGAGFYVNATKQPWSKHYKMYDYVTKELPQKLEQAKLPIDTSKASIFGHSMGGHGALALYLKNPNLYRSCSAFSPICHPTACPWGDKAFNGYLDNGLEGGKAYDATLLIEQEAGKRRVDILIDSGLADDFYKQKQLLPEAFEQAARKSGFKEDQVQVRLQDGYDHSYFFISTFAPEHIRFHAKFLNA